MSFLSPQVCHSCPHKLVIPGADQESRSHPGYKRVIPVPTSVSFLSPQVCHSWRRPGIQESPCIQACHSCPHKCVIPGTDQESRSHPGYKCVIPVPTSVSFLSPPSVSFLAQTRNPGVTLYTSVSFLSPQVCHSCPHKLVIPGTDQESRSHPGYKCVIPVPTSVSFLSPQVCHSWRRPGIQESPWIQVCHSCPHKCVIPGTDQESRSHPGYKCVIPVPTSVSFLAQTRNPGVTLYTSVSFLSPQACHSCPHKRVIPGEDQESGSHPVYKCVIPVPTSLSFLAQTRNPVPTSLSFLAQTRNPGVTLYTSVSFLSPQACHSCPHKLCHSLAQTRNPGVTLYTSVSFLSPQAVSFLSPQVCHSWRRPGIQESPWIQVCHSWSPQACHSCPHKLCHSWHRPGIQESPCIQACPSCPHKCVIPGADQESRSHPGYKRVIPVPTSLSFLAQTRNPGVTLYTSVSFLSPQVCHSCPHKLVIPGADQESRSHPVYKCVIPVPASVSFLAQTRNPGVTLNTSVSFLSPQACHSCPHKCVIPGADQESRSHPVYKCVIPVPTSVSFLSPQVCHSWRRPGIQESPWIQVCHSCPHKCVIPVPTSLSFLAQTRNPGVTLYTSVSFLSPQACHSCPHKLVIPGTDQESRSHPGYKRVIPVPTSLSFLSPQVCHSWRRPGIQESPCIQACHSCPHKRVIPVPTSVSFLAQTRNPGVTLYTSVSFPVPTSCVIPGADQESRSHPGYKCVIPVPTSVSFLSPQACHSWHRPGIQESPCIQVCHSWRRPACHSGHSHPEYKRVIPVPTSVSFLSPQACHSCPHKRVIPGADQESRSHPGYKCVIPVPASVSFLAQTRNPGVTLDRQPGGFLVCRPGMTTR